MSLQLGALRDALLDAGAKTEKADKAAEELAAYESRFTSVEKSLFILKLMVGTNIMITLIILGRLTL
jgi:hypothetical protein